VSNEPEAAGQDPEEVSRLLDAIKAFEAIEDPAERTRVVSEALRRWPDLHSELRRIRENSVRVLRDDRRKTWPEIAAIIGDVTPERAQQIGKGLSGAQRKKQAPKKQEPPAADNV
jgi:hypothetical protein